jgi:hypothetical protein
MHLLKHLILQVHLQFPLVLQVFQLNVGVVEVVEVQLQIIQVGVQAVAAEAIRLQFSQ